MKSTKKIQPLRCLLWLLFLLYLLLLARITLFKQVSLYNLGAAVGAGERSVSLLPFGSVADMVRHHVSLFRIVENVLGNILLFVPFGFILPALMKKEKRIVILYGVLLSLSIETVQLLFALGSMDVDDLMFNTLGTALGYGLFKAALKATKSSKQLLAAVLAVSLLAGAGGCSFLLVAHTELFRLSGKEVVVENEALVQHFIHLPATMNGKFAGFDGTDLTVEKSIHRADQSREHIRFRLDENSQIFLCYETTEFFFDSIIKEEYRYESLDYQQFTAAQAQQFNNEKNNVKVWSSDDKTVDYLVIIQAENGS